MRRSLEFAALTLALVAASARGAPSPRVGVLTVGEQEETKAARAALLETLRQAGLKDSVVERSAPSEGGDARAALFDLQRENVEGVVAVGDAASRLAIDTVRDRWVVCAAFDEGQAESLAGGNACVVTGAPPAAIADELRRVAPGLQRVAVLVPAQDDAARTAARRLGRDIEAVALEADGDTPRARAASAAAKIPAGVDLVWIPPSAPGPDAAELAALLAGRGIPLVGSCKAHLDAGCAVVVRPDPKSVGALAAVLAQQISAGADPGKTTTRRARRLRVEVDLQAARRLGFTAPPGLLAWADSFVRPWTAQR
jgi:ABC-type uncharacterized transport system substrate-binding protein